MISNGRGTIHYIGRWIGKHMEEAGANSMVVGVSGGIDSATALCHCKASLNFLANELTVSGELKVYGIILPCHSDAEAMIRAQELVAATHCESLDLSLEHMFNHVTNNISDYLPDSNDKNANASLRSCLRTPVLDYIAKKVNGLIIGTGNRDEDEVLRYYNKRGDGAVDISPYAQLHKSEMKELFAMTAALVGVNSELIDRFLNAVPSADLWGSETQTDEGELGLSYIDIQWGIRTVYDRIRRTPTAEDFRKLATIMSGHEQDVLLTLAQMEQDTRHKQSNVPVCDVRNQLLELVM